MSDYTLVRGEIAHLIGTPVADWSSGESTAVDACIRRGIHNVIHNGQHQWTWMRPVHKFKTAVGQRRYTLPLDFEQFIDNISFDGENYQYPSIEQKPATRLQQMESAYPSNGTPCYFAIETEGHDGHTEQLQQLVLHPTPDQAYPMLGIYRVGPIRTLSSDRPYFPGGPANKELFLQSCLATTESKFFDTQGEHHDAFQSTLANAIAEDLRRQPRNLGPLKGARGRKRGNIREALGWRLGTTYDGGTDL